MLLVTFLYFWYYFKVPYYGAGTEAGWGNHRGFPVFLGDKPNFYKLFHFAWQSYLTTSHFNC
jgi:hypothetical protein